MSKETIATHQPCNECGSSDARALYDDGSSYCFSCGHVGKAGAPEAAREPVVAHGTITGEPRELKARGISQRTCDFYDYHVGEYNGRTVQIANHYDESGKLAGQHFRTAEKEFWGSGKFKDVLYGMHKFPKGSSKMLVVTEGQIDALSFAESNGCKYPTVSLPNGFKSAPNVVRRNLEYLESFDKVIFCFDAEEEAQATAHECAGLLKPGKGYTLKLPYKDANEYLLKEGKVALGKSVWNAVAYRPDGIKGLCELDIEELMQKEGVGLEVPYPILNTKLRGLKKGKLYVVTAHSGIGKSTLTKEIAYHLRAEHNESVGMIYLEESQVETVQSMVAIDHNIHFEDLLEDPEVLGREKIETSIKKLRGGNCLDTNKLWMYDHFGSLSGENLLNKLRFLSVGYGCNYIILDHISIAISGEASSGQGERKDIDILMTKIRSLIEETGASVICVAHLVKPQNDEDALRPVSMYDLRGSAALYQLADYVIAMEDGGSPNVRKLKVLKNRRRGDSGKGYCDTLQYKPETGRLGLKENLQGDEIESFE